VAVDGRQVVNVALNRPSYQISNYIDGHGVYYAMYANDGSRVTHLSGGPCIATMSETNPWWAVDLTVPLHVAGVNFTNRDLARTYACKFNQSCSEMK